ncbi:hypothetical protein Acaty_m0207 (plasmid) [Acidithiobacillus caldus ATCC 51756]|uniref:Uncharacterized protein n=1 Tax=Acidithiobacillus caldus (strain ATCC 51756 / DSM 8584 / KU) TaxID=637389 RepID=A0A059ZZ51_ACICK|nr:hypothetical protein Acaty_m0207 [Acidithiobacillus caldus ATCC 51756]
MFVLPQLALSYPEPVGFVGGSVADARNLMNGVGQAGRQDPPQAAAKLVKTSALAADAAQCLLDAGSTDQDALEGR